MNVVTPDLLEQARARGVLITLQEGRVHLSCSQGKPDSDLLHDLRLQRAEILAYLTEMAARSKITVSVPMPVDPCRVCDSRHWIATLLPGIQEARPGASTWECGTCHPEIVESGGYVLHYGDVAALRADIADAVHQRGRYAPAPPDVSIIGEGDHTEKPKWGTVYADISQGRAITEEKQEFTFPANCSLSQFLDKAREITPVNRVFLCGPRPGQGTSTRDFLMWAVDPGMMEAYTSHDLGHYISSDKPDQCVFRYKSRATGQALDIHRITVWLGDDRRNDEILYTIEEARESMHILTLYLKQHFQLFKNLSGTPSTTFKNLWKQGNHIAGKKFLPLERETRDLIHQWAGQGRIEYFEDHTSPRVPGIYYYDGIFMYAGLTRELATEVDTHDFEGQYAGKRPARYRIKYTVPADWDHIGLFMTRREASEDEHWQRDKWIYPNQPGQTFETWVDGAELDVCISLYYQTPTLSEVTEKAEKQALKDTAYALATRAAFTTWQISILERIIYKPEKDSAQSDPLRTISEKMIKIREQMEKDARTDSLRSRAYKLARGAARNILLFGIGSFNRVAGTRVVVQSDQEPAPAGYINIEDIGDHRLLYVCPERADRDDDELLHPEWAARIWALCRARITKHALSQPFKSIICIRTDAIAFSHRVDALEDGVKVGSMRRKWAHTKAVKGPFSSEQFDALQNKHMDK